MLIGLNIDTDLFESPLVLLEFLLDLNLFMVKQVDNIWVVLPNLLDFWFALLPLDLAAASLPAPALLYAGWPVSTSGATMSELNASIDLPIPLNPILFLLSLVFELFFDLHGNPVNVLKLSFVGLFALSLT
jgi:hypothetical protein